MSFVLRTWQCANHRCQHQFESGEPYPECPRCRCVRVTWVPGGAHVGATAPALDAALRNLVDTFKLSNINSAQRGRAAKQVAAPAKVEGPPVTFAPGFSAPLTERAVCVPAPHVNFKVKTGVGNQRAPHTGGRLGADDIAAHTVVEYRHKREP